MRACSEVIEANARDAQCHAAEMNRKLALQGPAHSHSPARCKVSVSGRPSQSPPSETRRGPSSPCNSSTPPAIDEAANSVVQNHPVSSPLQLQAQAGRLHPFCRGRWWHAPSAQAPQQDHLRACADVLHQCLQQYRGGEPRMRSNPYVYRNGISYRAYMPPGAHSCVTSRRNS